MNTFPSVHNHFVSFELLLRQLFGNNNHEFLGLLFLFWLGHLACEILVPQSGMEPMPLAVAVKSPKHWTVSKVPGLLFFQVNILKFLKYFYGMLAFLRHRVWSLPRQTHSYFQYHVIFFQIATLLEYL